MLFLHVGGPRLKCQELLTYVMEIIRDPTSCAAYGSDCSSILLKDILSVRKYWCEISQQQWSGNIFKPTYKCLFLLLKCAYVHFNLFDALLCEVLHKTWSKIASALKAYS